MSSSSIETVAQWLGTLVVDEVQYLGAVKDKVEELQTELEWMQCFLIDADEKQTKNVLIRKWVSEIRDLAFYAEDLIESYILKVHDVEKSEGIINYLKWLTWIIRDAFTLHEIGCDLDVLTSKISKMTSRLQSYGVKSSYDAQMSHVIMSKRLLGEQRRTYGHVEEQNVVGLEECVRDLTSVLVGHKKVVVVHGMGGIGKSTLARELFHHAPLKEHFDGIAWAYISQQLQLGTVCREILLQIIPESDTQQRNVVQELQDSQLPGKLYEMLKQQRFLIVIDDVWFARDWLALSPAFPLNDTSCGSTLLITTRNQQILCDVNDDLLFYYEVKLLSLENCWQLLQKKANFRIDERTDPKKIELGAKMLEHCNGHPFAITVLGGVLATKKSLDEWQSVFDNLTYHLQGDESYSGVYEVLAMSYYELPYNTKPCFLHLLNFPEDYEIPLERLYHLWIANGIITSTQEQITRKRSFEEISEIYMKELVQKGMVQLGDMNSNGVVTTCRLHDLMRDKGLEIIKEENFLQIIEKRSVLYMAQQDCADVSSTKTARHLTIFVGDWVYFSIEQALSGRSSNLRSLVILPIGQQLYLGVSCDWMLIVCEEFPLLRVFDLEGLNLIGSLPNKIGDLIYLRYLSLKGTNITKLPSSISNLKSLLILDLRVKGSITLPNLLRKLQSLKHLYLPSGVKSRRRTEEKPYKTEDNTALVLDNMGDLEKLEGLDLDNLHNLGLQNMSSLRKMSLSCVSNRGALEHFLISPSIKHLNLILDANTLRDEPMLLSTCHALQVLYVDNIEHTTLPIRPNMYPQNLVKLSITKCALEDDPMQVLETLPKLKSLTLNVSYEGHDEMACKSSEGFPELTYLAFDSIRSLKKWSVRKGGLAKLQTLYISFTPIARLPQVLPSHVWVSCFPCVPGVERYGNCKYVHGSLLEFDDTEDI
ncbi:hypothetical protein RND81_03G161100 [Saponaria officinalis]|uniref:Uncharacterized protein n=1 Tax=Saponaria officinalis TaxID=3572 RepID=A0AAW1M849_SAPOF